jgi:hypothetical protein
MTTTLPAAPVSEVVERATVPGFAVITGAQVQRALQGQEKEIVELVAATYRLHGAGDSVNPPSYFLRFPDRPSARIIALPASIGGPTRVDGLKWISSFPENVGAGIPRASAVLILNDHDTGYPFACLEEPRHLPDVRFSSDRGEHHQVAGPDQLLRVLMHRHPAGSAGLFEIPVETRRTVDG